MRYMISLSDITQIYHTDLTNYNTSGFNHLIRIQTILYDIGEGIHGKSGRAFEDPISESEG